jgi:lysozyme
LPTFDQHKLDAELSRDEGRRANPYKDSLGILTVGIGHNLAAGPLPRQRFPMTEAQIDALFAADVASTVKKLDTYLAWWRMLSDARQRVLINMTFNLGMGRPGSGHGLLSFGQFLGYVRMGAYANAAEDMLATKWAKQVGARATRLSEMMKTG